MRVLFIFLDGIGLGENDPETNPFARAKMPNLNALLDGRSLLKESAPFVGEHATLLAIDPCVGVEGLPQSATGQGMLLTGVNISAEIGYHYGPKPNPEVAAHLSNGTLFSRFTEVGMKAILLNAYPPGYFAAINSGKRNYSSIPMSVTNAGIKLFDHEDFLPDVPSRRILQAKAGGRFLDFRMQQPWSRIRPDANLFRLQWAMTSPCSNTGPAITPVTNRIWTTPLLRWNRSMVF
jgi:hypothetical protein